MESDGGGGESEAGAEGLGGELAAESVGAGGVGEEIVVVAETLSLTEVV